MILSATTTNDDLLGGVKDFFDSGTWTVTRNLTVFFVPGKEQLPEFLAQQRVEVIASLPCYLEENVDSQRGRGVFDRSIVALRRLNALGYGQPGSELALNLVYNPVGPYLPPPQPASPSPTRVPSTWRVAVIVPSFGNFSLASWGGL